MLPPVGRYQQRSQRWRDVAAVSLWCRSQLVRCCHQSTETSSGAANAATSRPIPAAGQPIVVTQPGSNGRDAVSERASGGTGPGPLLSLARPQSSLPHIALYGRYIDTPGYMRADSREPSRMRYAKPKLTQAHPPQLMCGLSAHNTQHPSTTHAHSTQLHSTHTHSLSPMLMSMPSTQHTPCSSTLAQSVSA